MSRFSGNVIRIKSFMIQQTGSFHDVYNRSWEVDLSDMDLNSLRKRLMGAGRNQQLTPSSFQGIGSGILAPVAMVDPKRDLIQMPDGWDRPRCRFMMEVEVETRLGGLDTYYMQGFSEYLGLTASGNLDTEMRWFINGFIRVQNIERNTRRGVETFGIVKSSAQVINGRLIYDQNRTVHKTRTVDVFSSLQEEIFREGYADTVEDHRSVLGSPTESMFVHRADNLPGNFLSNALGTYRRNIDLGQFGTGTQDILDRTQQELNSELINLEENPFLVRLAQIQRVTESTYFTIDDLILIDENVGKRDFITGGELSSRAAAQLAHTNDVSDWRGADLESRWAVQITNGLGAIMMSKFHTKLSFDITNGNIRGHSIANVRDAVAVAENLPVEIFETMMADIESMFDDISGDGQDQFSIDVHASLYDQTEIYIKIGHHPEQHFFVPSFADSMMSQFYSRNKDTLPNMASDIKRLLSDLDGEMSGSAHMLHTDL